MTESSDPSSGSHQPVLLEEAIDGLCLKSGDIVVDCTFGRGGHSRRILEIIGESGRLLAFDKDLEAINSPEASALSVDGRLVLVHTSFSDLKMQVDRLGFSGRVSGILMDLGVSSPQLDQGDRGFSFLKDGPLDMRMNESAGQTAADWLAVVSELELREVLFRYGEERNARKIAKEIILRRDSSPLKTTGELARLIERCTPTRERGKHPATRSFQAIRIHINRELLELEECMPQAVDVLRPGGRLAVIAFHSLEDRIVKRFMRDAERGCSPEQARQRFETTGRVRLKRIGRAVKPGDRELMTNVRSRSAVLRIAEKVEQ